MTIRIAKIAQSTEKGLEAQLLVSHCGLPDQYA